MNSSLHGSPDVRRAALCSLGGVLFMGLGGLVAFVMFVVAVMRVLFGGFEAGGRALLLAFVVGLLSQLVGTVLLRVGAFMLRRAANVRDATTHAPSGAGENRRGVTIEGEVVEREGSGRPRLE